MSIFSRRTETAEAFDAPTTLLADISGDYTIDPTHSRLGFSARHAMVTTVRGEFRGVAATLDFDPENPAAATINATIDTRTMGSTGSDQRDGHLKSPDFLDVEKYPTMTFTSSKVEPTNGNQNAKVSGNLTIKDVTRPVVLDVEWNGVAVNPWGMTVTGFSATTKINREDFGLTWNMALEAGGWLVGKDVTITIDAEFIKVVEPVSEAVASVN